MLMKWIGKIGVEEAIAPSRYRVKVTEIGDFS
jgi:hypothetical protein